MLAEQKVGDSNSSGGAETGRKTGFFVTLPELFNTEKTDETGMLLSRNFLITLPGLFNYR